MSSLNSAHTRKRTDLSPSELLIYTPRADTLIFNLVHQEDNALLWNCPAQVRSSGFVRVFVVCSSGIADRLCPACSNDELLTRKRVFTACFYTGTGFDKLALQRQDTRDQFRLGWGAPYAGGPADQFSVRWEGDFDFTAGTNRFVMRRDDGARLFIDGRTVLDRWAASEFGVSYDVVDP